MDLGCGPGGSLDWLPSNAEGTGVDPADKY